MKEQLHHRFTDEEVRELFVRYINKEIPAHYIQTLLDIRRRRFIERDILKSCGWEKTRTFIFDRLL